MPVEKQRPAVLESYTVQIKTDHEKMYVHITYKEMHKPFEVFVTMSRLDSEDAQCTRAWSEALARVISIGLRWGVPGQVIAEQLRGLQCVPVVDQGGFVKSPADGIAKVLTAFCKGE